ncbi:MAG TPA: EamA/RhaT family transporter [Rhodospirillaceae bacterium]|uniref:DMT family transporter n=1 Tax=Hwanghaeella sp. 1Z406 TaxID=3402811 RepID=UPI000C8E9003|nr:multidrug transporter [Rhodospirillales bacterium]HBM12977.1 EamA/RhaT family transporter [Rhodospirillaceae bacterium]
MTDASVSEKSSHLSKNGLGIATMCLSVLLFAFMDTTVKWLGDGYPTSQIVFFRCGVALVPIFILVMMNGGLVTLKTQRPLVHLMRSTISIVTMSLIFWSFSQMRLADAIAILFAAPLLMTALSVPLLGERVGIRRWIAVCVGFVGVLIVVNPGSSVFDWASMAALLAAAGMALAMIITRKLSATETALTITFWLTLSGAIVGAIWVYLDGWVMPMATLDWALLIGVGLIGAIAQLTMTIAFRHAEVAILAPLDYLAIIWTTLLAYWIWGEIPVLRVFIGAAIVIASGIYIVHRETRVAKVRPVKTPKLRGRV